MYHAAAQNNIECFDELVKHGADVNLVAEVRILCIGVSVHDEDEASVVTTLDCCLGLPVRACMCVHMWSQNGMTSLIETCLNGHVSMVNRLAAAGADVNVRGVLVWLVFVVCVGEVAETVNPSRLLSCTVD